MNQCPLCKNSIILENEHHIIPQAAGGTNGPVVNICAMCHDALHQCAVKVMAGKSAEANYISDNIFTNKKLAQELIQSIVLFSLKKKEGQISDKTIDYKIILTLPGCSKKYIKTLAKDSHLSVVNYITTLILNEVKRKFPDFQK